MKKNYYELLEVSKNASPEVIEKVYKLLAKKYHPDLQPPEKKAEAEEMFKQISVAYETLSNENLRAKYDAKLEKELNDTSVSIEQYKKVEAERNHLAQEVDALRRFRASNTTTTTTYSTNSSTYNSNKSQQPPQYTTRIVYTNSPSSTKKQGTSFLGFNIPKLKDVLIFILSLIIIGLIIFILSLIPFTRNYFLNIYNEYPIIKFFVDLILGFIKTFINFIKSLFS